MSIYYIVITIINIFNFLILIYIAQRIDRANIRIDFLEFLLKLKEDNKKMEHNNEK